MIPKISLGFTSSLQTIPNINERRESHVVYEMHIISKRTTYHCLPSFEARVEEIVGWEEDKKAIRHNTCKIYCKITETDMLLQCLWFCP